ncbi:hypothetical protein [Microbacterium sp. NPDC056569]|uniref:hypothetical protein n=1 Tax=Microbacterium sp. NPDC056569 TaxID=3345867 RepID=UPI00366F44F8
MAITTDDVLDIIPRSFTDREWGQRLSKMLASQGFRPARGLESSHRDDAESLIAPYLVAVAAIWQLSAVMERPIPEVIRDLKADLLLAYPEI